MIHEAHFWVGLWLGVACANLVWALLHWRDHKRQLAKLAEIEAVRADLEERIDLILGEEWPEDRRGRV